MTQHPNYTKEVQLLYLELLLNNPEIFARCQSIFDSSLFDRTLQFSAEFIHTYATSNNSTPTIDIVNACTQQNFRTLAPLDDRHTDWLMDEFERFIRHKSLERAILSSADMLELGQYGDVELLIKEAVEISLTRDLGTNYFHDPKTRLLQFKNKNGQISTGWESLDDKLYGGMNRGELNIFAGGSGAGKSLFLTNLALNWAFMNLTVVYISLELSEQLVAMRMDAMISGFGTKDIFKHLDDVEYKVLNASKQSGAIQLKYLPSGKTTNDIRAYIKEFEIQSSKKIDVILIDYLDLMGSIKSGIKAGDSFTKDKFVSEELRNLAMAHNCIVVSASQLNRSAVEESIYDHSHIGGGLSKIQTADNVFGIHISKNLRERGLYEVQLMKTRSSSGVGHKFYLNFNVDSLRITNSSVSEIQETPSTMASSIQKRNNTNDRSSHDIPSTKPSLRDLLDNMADISLNVDD